LSNICAVFLEGERYEFSSLILSDLFTNIYKLHLSGPRPAGIIFIGPEADIGFKVYDRR
jgi:hypothetical protein